MAMTIRLRPQEFSDVAFVEGVRNHDSVVQKHFYLHCKKYFMEHYRAVFFAPDHLREDIFQNTYLALWDNIERGKIKVSGGVVTGRDDEPLKCSLMTYMMSIARLKYMEVARQTEREAYFSDLAERKANILQNISLGGEWLHHDERIGKLEVISDCIAVMSERCRKILTLFYAEEMKLDEMLAVLPTFTSKDALKTAKNKCLDKLRNHSISLYQLRRKQ